MAIPGLFVAPLTSFCTLFWLFWGAPGARLFWGPHQKSRSIGEGLRSHRNRKAFCLLTFAPRSVRGRNPESPTFLACTQKKSLRPYGGSKKSPSTPMAGSKSLTHLPPLAPRLFIAVGEGPGDAGREAFFAAHNPAENSIKFVSSRFIITTYNHIFGQLCLKSTQFFGIMSFDAQT